MEDWGDLVKVRTGGLYQQSEEMRALPKWLTQQWDFP